MSKMKKSVIIIIIILILIVAIFGVANNRQFPEAESNAGAQNATVETTLSGEVVSNESNTDIFVDTVYDPEYEDDKATGDSSESINETSETNDGDHKAGTVITGSDAPYLSNPDDLPLDEGIIFGEEND